MDGLMVHKYESLITEKVQIMEDYVVKEFYHLLEEEDILVIEGEELVVVGLVVVDMGV
jgi:hypothetical protein